MQRHGVINTSYLLTYGQVVHLLLLFCVLCMTWEEGFGDFSCWLCLISHEIV